MMRKLLSFTLILCLSASVANSQVLISLLFGDKLNSPNLEFGLETGVNWSNISNVDQAERLRNFHLGFYFDFTLSQKFYLHTGLIMVSQMGAKSIPPYELGNDALDSILSVSTVKRKLGYINLPVYLRWKFAHRFFVEAGPQFGYLLSANDEFVADLVEKEDLSFNNKVTSSYNRFDAGITGGLGYRIMSGNGMNIGFRYYQGLLNILKDNPGASQTNSSFYLYVSIPVGAGKATESPSE